MDESEFEDLESVVIVTKPLFVTRASAGTGQAYSHDGDALDVKALILETRNGEQEYNFLFAPEDWERLRHVVEHGSP